MRIIVISTPIFQVPVSGYSGLEHLAWLTAKGLAVKGHQVGLVAPDGSECPGVQIIPTGPAGMVNEQMAYGGFKGNDQFGRQVEVQPYWQHLLQANVVIDHSWECWSMMLKREGRMKAPILKVAHAPVDTMYRELPQPGLVSFVCISEDQASHFRGLFSRDCRVCHNGVDGEFYKPLDIPRSGRFLFLARFSTIKGPDLAIEACRKAGVGLDLIGDTQITNEPEYLEKCRKMCDVWPIRGQRVNGLATSTGRDFSDKRIAMIGPASRGETVWWYNQAHCMVHPNQRFREPFGLAPVESMLCGCPVIAWDHGAMRETIKHGETGWLVKSMDELVSAIRYAYDGGDHVHPSGIRKHCREWALQFSVGRMVSRYEELCHEAIQTGGW